MTGWLSCLFCTRKFPILITPEWGRIMSADKSYRDLEGSASLQRQITEMDAEKAAEYRSLIDRVKSLERGWSLGKHRRRRQSGGIMSNGALSPEQIERIQYYRRIGISYGEISYLMTISKSSAYKYGKDIQSLS